MIFAGNGYTFHTYIILLSIATPIHSEICLFCPFIINSEKRESHHLFPNTTSCFRLEDLAKQRKSCLILESTFHPNSFGSKDLIWLNKKCMNYGICDSKVCSCLLSSCLATIPVLDLEHKKC